MATIAALGGCTALLDMRDVVFASGDGGVDADGGRDGDGSPQDGAATLDGSQGGDSSTGTDGGPGVPVPLTIGNRPWGLAIDDTYVFWSEPFNYVIGRVGKDGSDPIPLATGSTYAFGTMHVVADGTDVFWTRLDFIYRCARNGCNGMPTAVASNLPNSARAIAVDATNVYYGDDTAMQIRKVAKTGGPTSLVSSLAAAVNDMVVLDGTIYATLDNGTLATVPATGGTAGIRGSPSAVEYWGLALRNGFLYLTTFADPGTLQFATLDGGVLPFALAQRYPFGVTADDTDVYWTSTGTLGQPNGTVSRCSIAQCVTPTPIAEDQDTPKWIRSDPAAIYWTNQGNAPNSGGLMKLVK